MAKRESKGGKWGAPEFGSPDYKGPNAESHFGKQFGHPTKGTGYGKFGAKAKRTTKIGDERKENRINKPGKGTATRRGDRFPNRQKFSFGSI